MQTDDIQVMKVTKFAENTQSRGIGLFNGGPPGKYKIVIKTQYSGSAKPLKELRVIESSFTMQH